MEYIITFSDVMAGVITLALGIITFFIKKWIEGVEKSNSETQKKIEAGNKEIREKIDRNDAKVNERIDKLEKKTDADIQGIRKEINQMKTDFPITYVLREDYIRIMNNVEMNIKEVDKKIDTLLLAMNKDK